MRELTYLVAVTQDGVIAGPGGEFDFFVDTPALRDALLERWPETLPTVFRQAHGVDGPGTRFDAVLMGRATYEVGVPHGMTSPYAHLDQYVVSSTLQAAPDPAVTLVDGDPCAAVRDLLARPGRGIWLCGGGRLAATLVDEIDELVLKRHPVVAGAGVRLFDGAMIPPRRFEVVADEPLADGVRLTRLRRAG